MNKIEMNKRVNMNIHNLNTQELEQLQILLNKMNPSQPTEKIYFDPVNKMIDKIMGEMDWEKIQMTMEYLRWEWRGEYVTVDMLKEESERLLRGAVESRLEVYKETHYEVPVMHGCGGLEAKAWCNEDKTRITGLNLSFVLSSWDDDAPYIEE
jgi:predicted transcriptional regulator